jgi:predicted DNA-binding transcriptional regulator YafY
MDPKPIRIDRMLSIVVILLNRRKITARELADRFEVSLRTVYRDINAINLAGIPVISNQGTGGGYELPENYKFNKQFMSIADLQSILCALKGVNAVLDDDDIEMIFEKVQSLLPRDETQDPACGSDMIIFDTHGWGGHDKTAPKIQQLYDAIKNSHLIQIRYLDSHGRASLRFVEPLSLIQKGFAWYLFGFCRKRRDERLFKLSRIKQIRQLDDVFERKNRSYRQCDTRWEPKPNLIDVVLKFSIEVKHRVEDYHEDAHVLAEDDCWMTIKTKLPDGDWLLEMILSYGAMVEVLAPEDLVQRIQKRTETIAAIYKNRAGDPRP